MKEMLKSLIIPIVLIIFSIFSVIFYWNNINSDIQNILIIFLISFLGISIVTFWIVLSFLHPSAHSQTIWNSPSNIFYRVWLWLTIGINIPEWLSIHRYNHIRQSIKGDLWSSSDPWNDIHKPNLFFRFWRYFSKDSQNENIKSITYIDDDFHRPNDRLEKLLLGPFHWLGPCLSIVFFIIILGNHSIIPIIILLFHMIIWRSESVNADSLDDHHWNNQMVVIKERMNADSDSNIF